jgi:hypothetical protein
MRLQLHGVVRSGHLLPPDNPRVRLVRSQDLAVAVSDLADGQGLTAEDAMAHLEVLCDLVSRGPVVPLLFGTTASDEAAVRSDVLLPDVASLSTQLDRLDGLVEVHVYLRFDEDTALAAVLDRHENTVRSGRMDLMEQISAGERIARHVIAWRQERVKTLLDPISVLARETVSLPEQEHTTERRAILLPLEHLEAARSAVAELTADGVTATFVGPLPAFSFLTPAPAPQPADTTAASRWGW